MHIGFSSFSLNEGKTGIAAYIVNLLKALQQIDSINTYDILLNKNDSKLIPIISQNFHKLNYPAFIDSPIANILWHNVILPVLAKRKKYDLVHIPTIRRIPLIKGCKIVATVHDLAVFAIPDKYDRLRKFYHQTVLSRLINRCDHIIAVSHHTKEDILRFTQYPENKISVIYSGIDHYIFKPTSLLEAKLELKVKYQLSSPFIVYVARIEHPGKNHINLIKAFERLKKQTDKDYKLVFAGADWNGAESVKDYAANSPENKSIKFLGYVSQDDIVSLYSTCDLMVFPSLYEGFGFPVIEALACGAPVICSRTSSLIEVGKEYVQFFDPLNPENMYQCMLDSLSPNTNKAFRDWGMKYALNFDWKVAANQVLEVYEKTVSGAY